MLVSLRSGHCVKKGKKMANQVPEKRILFLSYSPEKENRRLHQILDTWRELGWKTTIYELNSGGLIEPKNQSRKMVRVSKFRDILFYNRRWMMLVIRLNSKILKQNYRILQFSPKWLQLTISFLFTLFLEFPKSKERDLEQRMVYFRDNPALKNTLQHRREIKKLIALEEPDVIYFENYYSWLWVNLEIIDKRMIIYDAPEFAAGSPGISDVVKDFILQIEHEILSKAKFITTVSAKYREILANHYGKTIDAIFVITNAVREGNSESRMSISEIAQGNIKEINSVKGRKLLFHGALIPHRNIAELCLEFNEDVGDWNLVVMGSGPLLDFVRSISNSKIIVIEKVPPSEISEILKWVDACVVPYSPVDLNHKYSVPNKFFDSVSSFKPILVNDGLAILSSWVEMYSIGLVMDLSEHGNLAGILKSGEVTFNIDRANLFLEEHGWGANAKNLNKIISTCESSLF